MKEYRLDRGFRLTICVCAGGMLVLILALLLMCQQAFAGAYQNRALLPNWLLWPAALVVVAGLFALRGRETAPAKDRPWLLRAVFLAALAVQFVVVRCCWTHLGWDPGQVHDAAERIARGLDFSIYREYFSRYPNNAAITLLFVPPLWAAVRLGLGVPYVALPYLGAVMLNISAYLCVRCLRLLTHSRVANGLGTALAIGWIALSPYNLYPYTDVFTILFPISMLTVWLRVKRSLVKWSLISLLAFLGAALKPTVLIGLIALLMIQTARFFGKRLTWARARTAALALLAMALCAVPGRVFEAEATRFLTGSAHPQAQHSITHFFMMGMNNDTYGGNDQSDVAYSASFPTLKQRRQAEMARGMERLSSRGLAENLRFFAVKAYKAYADGSFASHGSFIDVEIPQRSSRVSAFLRSLYHKKGRLMPYCQTVAQLDWLGVLTLCAYTAFTRRREPAVAAICLTLIGLTLYLLIFEVWPRYLFLYAPYFVLLSALALDRPLRKARHEK